MKRKEILSVLIGLVSGIISLPAQQNMPASGSFSFTGQGSVSVSIGQFSYSLFSGTLGELSEGVQQPYELFVITAVNANDMLNLKAYPNPTSGMLILKSGNLSYKTLEYKLFDSQGRLMKSEMIIGDMCIISFSGYASGIYILNVLSDNKHLKTFKIIRNE